MVVIKFTDGITKGCTCDSFDIKESRKSIVIRKNGNSQEVSLRDVICILVDGAPIWKNPKELIG